MSARSRVRYDQTFLGTVGPPSVEKYAVKAPTFSMPHTEPLLSFSLQEGGVHPTVTPPVSCTPPAVGEKYKLLRRIRVCVQLPELDTHLPRRLHHVLVHQRLWLHGDELSSRQSESGLFGLLSFCLIRASPA